MAIVIPDEMEAAFVEFMSNQQHYVYNPNGADFIKCRGCGAIAECTNHQKMEFGARRVLYCYGIPKARKRRCCRGILTTEGATGAALTTVLQTIASGPPDNANLPSLQRLHPNCQMPR